MSMVNISSESITSLSLCHKLTNTVFGLMIFNEGAFK